MDLGDVASRVSSTFQALPSYPSNPAMGQFNLGPITFGTSTPGQAPSMPSIPGGVSFGSPNLGPVGFGGFGGGPGFNSSPAMPSLGLGPIMFGGAASQGSNLQLNTNGTTYTAPPPQAPQPNAPNTPSGPYNNSADVESYIRNAAAQKHIDPDIAAKVFGGEGKNAYVGDNGSSFGPFQLHYGGVAGGGNAVVGLGDTFQAQTGLDARDPSTWKAQVDWVMNGLANGRFDWSPWHGAAANGITGNMGIGTYNGPVPDYLNSTEPKTAWQQAAESQLTQFTGKPYHYGGHDPTTGFDCSGFVSWVFHQQGINLTPQTQWMFNETQPTNNPKKGDLVFFNMDTSDPHLQHVGIYMGDGTFINDTDYGGKSGVQISSLKDWANQKPQFRAVPGAT